MKVFSYEHGLIKPFMTVCFCYDLTKMTHVVCKYKMSKNKNLCCSVSWQTHIYEEVEKDVWFGFSSLLLRIPGAAETGDTKPSPLLMTTKMSSLLPLFEINALLLSEKKLANDSELVNSCLCWTLHLGEQGYWPFGENESLSSFGWHQAKDTDCSYEINLFIWSRQPFL